eukprot:scaffold4714_cov19-Tisochrysis_lutea.AAC.3
MVSQHQCSGVMQASDGEQQHRSGVMQASNGEQHHCSDAKYRHEKIVQRKVSTATFGWSSAPSQWCETRALSD